MKPLNTTSSIYAGTSTTSASAASTSRDASGSVMNRGTMSFSQTTPPVRASEPSIHSSDSFFTSGRNLSTSSSPHVYQYASTQPRSTRTEPVYSQGTLTPPNLSPRTQRRASPNPVRSHERNLSGSFNFTEPSPTFKYEQQSVSNMLQLPLSPVVLHDSGRRSPRMDRSSSPAPFSKSAASTLPRSFAPIKSTGRRRKNLQYGNQTFKVTQLLDH